MVVVAAISARIPGFCTSVGNTDTDSVVYTSSIIWQIRGTHARIHSRNCEGQVTGRNCRRFGPREEAINLSKDAHLACTVYTRPPLPGESGILDEELTQGENTSNGLNHRSRITTRVCLSVDSFNSLSRDHGHPA